MTKRKRHWAIGLGSAFLLLLILALIWNWDWFKPIAENRASSALHRHVTIGHLSVNLRWHPTLTLNDLVIDNPPGFPGQGHFATLSRLAVKIDPWPLFHHHVVIDGIVVDRLQANLDAPPGATPNWTLPSGNQAQNRAGKSSYTVAIGSIAIHRSNVHVLYPRYRTDMTLAIETLPRNAEGSQEQKIRVDLDGRYSDQPISGWVIGGALLSLSDSSHPYPLDASVINGETRLRMNGTLNNPMRLGAADVRVELQGRDLADLYPLTGVTLPHTAKYQIGGRLDYAPDMFRFTEFAGSVGKSDLEGEILVNLHPTPRKITMNLHSRAVDMVDLGGFIGARPRHGKAAQNEKSTGGNPGVLPDTPINLPELRSADLDVHYAAADIKGPRMPLDNLEAHLTTHNGDLRVDPLKFGVGGGNIDGSVDLSPAGDKQVRLQTDINFNRVSFGHVIRTSAGYKGEGTIGGSVELTGTGRSAADIAADGNGDVKLFMSGGNVSAVLVDLIGLDLGKSLFSALGIPTRTRLRCMVSHWSLDQGVLDTKIMLVDTTEANIIGDGKVNLRNNSIHYTISTHPKHFSIGSVAAPIEIKGALKDPTIRPNLVDLGTRGGLAAALAAVATPFAALIATIQLGLGKDNDCGDLIQQVKQAGHH